ncbi:MAG: hypothetical protein IT236_10670, partial [Bacteroidia bacterium]|nr:hypothetical protein [Bacteroidia bacterium]
MKTTQTNSYCIKKTGVFLLVLFCAQLFAQTPADTINKRNPNKQKTGYWAFYLDAQYNKCPSKSAKYKGFTRFYDGKTQVEPTARDNKRDRMFYKAFPDTGAPAQPQILNGELFTFYMSGGKEKLRFCEVFRNGKLSETREYFFQDSDTTAEVNICYYDSLFNNIPTSYLFYKFDRNIPLYRQYVGRKKTLTGIEFLVKHHDSKFKYRPIIGIAANLDKPSDKTIKTKNFLELGVTRRYYKSVYIDTTKKTYHDKFGIWHAFNFSLLGSNTGGKFCLGQKLTYSYTFAVLRAEAGII